MYSDQEIKMCSTRIKTSICTWIKMCRIKRSRCVLLGSRHQYVLGSRCTRIKRSRCVRLVMHSDQDVLRSRDQDVLRSRDQDVLGSRCAQGSRDQGVLGDQDALGTRVKMHLYQYVLGSICARINMCSDQGIKMHTGHDVLGSRYAWNQDVLGSRDQYVLGSGDQ